MLPGVEVAENLAVLEVSVGLKILAGMLAGSIVVFEVLTPLEPDNVAELGGV